MTMSGLHPMRRCSPAPHLISSTPALPRCCLRALGAVAGKPSNSATQAERLQKIDWGEPVAEPAATPIDKYLEYRAMRRSHPHEYYKLMMTHQDDVLPYIYTPTVGEACQRYHELPLVTEGLYLTLEDRGRIAEKLRALPLQNASVIVVTDGERILGLGDLGANGMGISEGKITLYTAAAGVDPRKCLPICLDMGTNNVELRNDPKYKGLRRPRASIEEFDAMLAEFMDAVKTWSKGIVVQFEDFGGTNAFRLLEQYRHRQPCFNDDIQGTASITLAALLAALRASGDLPLSAQRIMFLGAGEAGTGIGQLIAYCLHRRSGISMQEALEHCFYVDSKGLICRARLDDKLPEHKRPFAHDVPFCPDLKSAIEQLRPNILIGVSTAHGAFDEEIITAMCRINERPIVMPLSNPTCKEECTFEEAYRWSHGKVMFASGSPFDPILSAEGHVITPAQANNAYIFPALGHAASLMHWPEISDDAFLLAAEELACMATVEDIQDGRLFPPFSKILDVSASIMGRLIQDSGHGDKTREECNEIARKAMWHYSSLQPVSMPAARV